ASRKKVKGSRDGSPGRGAYPTQVTMKASLVVTFAGTALGALICAGCPTYWEPNGMGGSGGTSAGLCPGHASATFSVVYPEFGAPGCAGDGTEGLRAAAQIDGGKLQIRVETASDTEFTAGTLELFAGDEPGCSGLPTNWVGEAPVQPNVMQQFI